MMTPERWRKVEEIYHAVSEKPSAERPSLLEALCPDDADLRREVDELLRQDAAPDSLLDAPRLAGFGGPELTPGQSLGPYRIGKLLGTGGMGRVYQAIDTRLGRSVAIKVSRGGFTGRFRREARAVAALNHPNICTLYDLGPNYLVMEHVEGAPIRGPMPLSQAFKVAIAIADALDTAHRKGVIHRDLKPANILLTESGPKLLDFGLAKLDAGAAGVIPDSMTSSVAAQATIAGTMQYMSPEQLQGRAADARSDIFSFGVVLFEMLTGHPAFEADNAASLIAAVLTAQPRARRYLPDLPPEIERVLDRALAKDPEDRWQSARDLKTALEWAAAPPARAASAPASSWNRVAWMLAGAFGLAAAGLAWLHWGPAVLPDPPPASADAGLSRTPQLTLYDRTGRVLGTVGAQADYSNPAFSPDGKRVAVAIRDSTRRRDIWVFDLEQSTRQLLTNDPADETNPVWSPDGTEIVYCSERLGRRDLYARTSSGGPERLLYASNVNKNPLDWARDGSAIYYNVDRPEGGHDIWMLPLKADPSPKIFLRTAENRDWMAASPDHRWMLFRTGGSPGNRIVLRAIRGSAIEWPVGGRGTTEGHWRGDGREFYYIAERTMMAQPVETEADEVRLGVAKPLFKTPTPYDFGRNAFTVSSDGRRFVLRTGT